MRRNARWLWLEVHSYFGLIAGALFALLALTGSILVFGAEIDRLLNPRIAGAVHGTSVVAADSVLRTVERQFGRRAFYLELPGESRAYQAFIMEGDESSLRPSVVSVDSVSGSILMSRPWGGFFVSFVHELHKSLLLDRPGPYVVAGIGVLALVSILTGLYLWWPRAAAWRNALAFNRRRRGVALSFEAHRTLGFYLSAVMLVMVCSGLYLVLPKPISTLVGLVAPVTAHPGKVLSSPPAASARPLTLVALQRIVAERSPGATISGFLLPRTRDGSFSVYYRGSREPSSSFGLSTLWIDQYSGAVLAARDYSGLNGVDRGLHLQILFHNGEILGRTGQVLVLITGVGVVSMYIFGVHVWWKRRRRAKRSGATRILSDSKQSMSTT